jgi:hypothetical protein
MDAEGQAGDGPKYNKEMADSKGQAQGASGLSASQRRAMALETKRQAATLRVGAVWETIFGPGRTVNSWSKDLKSWALKWVLWESDMRDQEQEAYRLRGMILSSKSFGLRLFLGVYV